MTGRLHIIVWIFSGHRIQLDQVPEVWLLQDCMATSIGGVNLVALDLSVTYQVSVPHCFWLGLSVTFIQAGSCCISSVVPFHSAS